jgi:hypothetical protein
MSSETTVCPGCNNTFTLRGYQSHLAQSNDPLCSAVFDQLKKAYEINQALALSSDELEAEAPNFQADASAGDDSDMFVQGPSANRSHSPSRNLDGDDSDSDSDDELEADNITELEKGWEPLREGAPDQLDDADNEDRRDTDNSDPDADPGLEEDLNNQHNRDRYIIGDGYGVKPAVRIRYSDKYISSHAGEALSREESRDSGYGAALGGGDNPWSPFYSKKDWEIANWAKLRGVGSTAFSDLLAIDGVSVTYFVITDAILTYYWIGLRSPQPLLQKLQ